MKKFLFSLVGICTHDRVSFPVNRGGLPGSKKKDDPSTAYVACLDCGKEFPCDAQKMVVIDKPITKGEKHEDSCDHGLVSGHSLVSE